jgi:uncharacterized protein YndB with AHSA1/START domain
MDQNITVESIINAPLAKVWELYTKPEHIVNWNNASEDWHTTKSENDLRAGGKFMSRMEAKDGSVGFDFGGIYDEVVENSLIKYTMGDGRKAAVTMTEEDGGTKVTVTFDLESENTPEKQRSGWQAILDNFKKYVEANLQS